METAELLKKVRKVEIKTKGLSSRLFAGEYQSAFKGRGISFSEVREYQPGDETRLIDWNVTAKLDHPYIKVFEEDREMNVLLMIDVSGSSSFGTVTQLKEELIVELSALIAYSAINNNDKVAVLFFSDKIEKFIPAKKGRSHTLRIIRELLDFTPQSKGTDLNNAFRFINNVMTKRSIVFVLSDFLSRSYGSMFRIAARKHDVIGLHIYDDREKQFPAIGMINVIDTESGKQFMMNTSDIHVRTAYAKKFYDSYNYFITAFRNNGSDYISISTKDNYVKSLMALFEKRVKQK